MMQVLVIARETFLLLRRDRVFFPAIGAGVFFFVMANLASGWSIEDFHKILFDIGAFGYHMTGGVIAVFWGTKVLSDSQQSGFLEVKLAAPVSRTAWLLGTYLGLVSCLLILALLLIVVWQAFMILNDFGVMSGRQFLVFVYLTFVWMILGSLAIFFSSFCGNATATFSTASLWLVGLTSKAIANALSAETSQNLKMLVHGISRFWNLQSFNLSEAASPFSQVPFPSETTLWWTCLYGITTIGLLISSSGVIFSRRNL